MPGTYISPAETGLYYLQSRYYDAKICRFISPDAVISGVGGDVLGYNRYAYCFNNPVNLDDDSGNWPSLLKAAKKIVKSVKTYVKEKIIEPVKKVVKNIKEDYKNFDKNNESEEKVYNSNYVSSYKGAIVVKTPFDASFSYGIIGLSTLQQNSETLNHEYGHTVQMKNKGIIKFTTEVAIPSVTANVLDRMDKLPYDYYSYPWEAEANEYGGITITEYGKAPLPPGEYHSYWDLIKLFFE